MRNGEAFVMLPPNSSEAPPNFTADSQGVHDDRAFIEAYARTVLSFERMEKAAKNGSLDEHLKNLNDDILRAEWMYTLDHYAERMKSRDETDGAAELLRLFSSEYKNLDEFIASKVEHMPADEAKAWYEEYKAEVAPHLPDALLTVQADWRTVYDYVHDTVFSDTEYWNGADSDEASPYRSRDIIDAHTHAVHECIAKDAPVRAVGSPRHFVAAQEAAEEQWSRAGLDRRKVTLEDGFFPGNPSRALNDKVGYRKFAAVAAFTYGATTMLRNTPPTAAPGHTAAAQGRISSTSATARPHR
ncbi:hypothetical protein ACFV2D_36000 [Streptomyces capillispiralis]|uniref:hypothetical protein n=1 Tax=Streptomyces capillispiralis TaxID=68182 RepID=UPI0036B029BB